MKKFLSLVLALVLTMSLVVVPANATNSVTRGDTATIDAPAIILDDVTVSGGAVPTGYKISNTKYSWKVFGGIEIVDGSSEATVTVKGKTAGDATATCTYTVTLTKEGSENLTGTASKDVPCKVIDALLASDVRSVKVNGRSYAANAVYLLPDETSVEGCTAKLTNGYEFGSMTLSGNDLTVITKGGLSCTISCKRLSDELTAAADPDKIVFGGTTELTATYDDSTNTAYTWTLGDKEIGRRKSVKWTAPARGTAGDYEITCTAKEGSIVVATGSVTVKVVADTFRFVPTAQTLQKGQELARDHYVTFKDTKANTEVPFGELADVNYTSSNPTVLTVNTTTGQVTAMKDGTAAVTVKGTYLGKPYTGTVSFTVISATAALGSVDNGDNRSYSSTEIKNAVVTAINKLLPRTDKIKADNITELTISSVPNAAGEGVLYKTSMTNANKLQAGYPILNSNVIFDAAEGRIGTVSFDVSAVTTKGSYAVTLEIPVTGEKDISETVSGEEYSATQVSFVLPDDYAYWFVSTGSSLRGDNMYDGYWTKNGASENSGNWTRYAAGAEVKQPLSQFTDGRLMLYVVGLDKNGVASTGTLEVYLDSHDIEYSGVVGENISFAQVDFEEFLQERAKDAKLIGSKSSTAYVEFDKVTFTIPNATKEGDLYNNGTKISKASTACEDLDKVSFAPASKAGSEVYIKFTVYGDYYATSTTQKPTKTVEYTGRVLVNVVREDIKYTVPADGAVMFNAADFQSYFAGEFKNGTLDYVSFDKLPAVTDGALYATYSTYAVGTLAKTTDKFYYEPSSTRYNDLDDVAFRTPIWSKSGDKIYIPFTAYGTVSKIAKSVTGWVAITVTKEMSFTDVKTTDWFYSNVKNAFGMGLIEGKTATTFNPNDNMTYAEAVTLAARMHQLSKTGKVTLSNSTYGNWYSNYESYAISNGIISSALGDKANKKITRKDYVDIFYNALPASAYTVRNTVSSIPDLANNTANAKVYAFYRAGILTGYANTPGKTNGAFGPNDNIKRSEVATILIRMMDASARVYFYI